MKLTFNEMYDAVVRRDSGYEGIFFTAVKSTGIFCRPTCKAKKPMPHNVTFYNSVNEALANGYRPCKLCRPTELPSDTPPSVSELISELNENPGLRLREADLIKRGLDPGTVRRWFKKHHNLTFAAYQRMLRINTALKEINSGETVTGAAFDSGYESVSGFSAGIQAVFGESPRKSALKNIINIERIVTPLGPMYAGADKEGLCLLEYTDRRMLESEIKDLRRRLKAEVLPGVNEHIDQVKSELEEYFAGKRKIFTVKINAPGTDFQKLVWQKLREIPYGETRSYSHQAALCGKPKAVRAAASANGANRISIVIPCHRVIGEDGELRGYGGGLARKRWLIDFEKGNP